MKPVAALLTLLCAGLAALASAQEYSYDGNRWYEVEVLVFRNLGDSASVSERPSPAVTRSNTAPLRELASPLEGYRVDFEALVERMVVRDDGAPLPFGPERQLQAAGNFRLTDFARDGWIALPAGLRSLGRDHQRLQDSPNHDILWHEAWRQPLPGPAQAPAVALSAEDPFLAQQLVGSLRLMPFNGATLRFEVALDLVTRSGTWSLREGRELLPGAFHYFDNPAFGVLLRVQSYVLPPLLAPEVSSDF